MGSRVSRGRRAERKGAFSQELTSYEKTKTTQQQAPQRDSHLSSVSWPCAAPPLSAGSSSLRPRPPPLNTDTPPVSGRDRAATRVKWSPRPSRCSLTALDQLSVSHIVLQEIRRLLPLWGSCSPRCCCSSSSTSSSAPLLSIVVLISCSQAKDNVTTRKTPRCLHV